MKKMSGFFRHRHFADVRRVCVFMGLLALLVSAALFFASASPASPAPAGGPPTVKLKTFLKGDYANHSGRSAPVPDPNVLFLLDVGSPMVFSPKGIMPLKDDGRTDSERSELLKQCTYGSGARPYNENSGSSYSRYGRDRDDTNNIIGDPDCYYTSDPTQPYLLTFRNKSSQYQKPIYGWVSDTTGIYYGTSYQNGYYSQGWYSYYCRSNQTPPANPVVGDVYYEWSGTRWYRQTYAITGYETFTVQPGEMVGENHGAYDNLVPNDSRMYMMKLVFWRLTDASHADMLSRMRVGMATTYQEQNYGTSF
ncbi:MAG: hypothetical protein GX256_00635, partial [Fretibacterium sp.]|nr:hypothetical protein [Fretibacterium sp.]